MLIEAGWKPPSPKLQAQIDKAEVTYIKYLLKMLNLTHPEGYNRVLDKIISDMGAKERAELIEQIMAEQAKEATPESIPELFE